MTSRAPWGASGVRAGILAACLAIALVPRPAAAWGATGHEWVSGLAMEVLPEELPAFLRTPEVAAEVTLLGRELDRSKGSGTIHDRERDPGHYVNLDDDGNVMGGVPLNPLPASREAYDTALRAKGFTQYQVGYLPYSIIDGWQQLRKDFAYWRADVVAARSAVDPEHRAWFEADRRLREKLIVRDLGIWSHYIGDASQPLHVSMHYNGWGNYPNPRGFTTSNKLHAQFEGEYVRRFANRAAVKSAIAPYKACECGIEERMRMIILDSQAQVVPLYELEQRGAFKGKSDEGVAFITARLAVGSSMLRDMIVDVWRASADMGVGYPIINVRDIESGKRMITPKDFGGD